MNGFVLFRLEILTSAVSINLLFPLPYVIRAFCDTSWLVHSRFKDGGEGIWEAICSWAIYELLTSYIFVRTFKPCLGCLVHVVSVSLCYMVMEPAALLGVPCPEWEIPH